VEGAGAFTRVEEPPATPLPERARPAPSASADRSASALPAAWNWCDPGLDACTPVKDQGNCGSCWAFATAGVFESAIRIQDGVTRDLAEQYLVSCNQEGWGCDGGGRAFDYYTVDGVIPPGEPFTGAVYEAEFPYLEQDYPCNPPHTHYEQLLDWDYAAFGVPVSETIKQAIHTHGPVYVSVCAGSAFQDYDGGIFLTDESAVCDGGTNHGVILVGWDDTESGGFWHLKNS